MIWPSTDDVPALDWPGLDALLQDPRHSLLLQDVVSHFYCLPVSAGLQVLEELASSDEVSLGWLVRELAGMMPVFV